MIHLRSIAKKSMQDTSDYFPMNVSVIQNLDSLDFTQTVTFFVGENGSGKSTLLEAVAVGAGSIAIGGEDLQRDTTLRHARVLSSNLKFIWQKKTHKGFFLRAEDFFNFTRRINSMNQELDEMSSEFESKFKGYALQLALGASKGQKSELTGRYGENADARSHGESFLNLFRERFVPGGLYLLDEPEAPLSPQRQLVLLSMLKEMQEQDAQFIIATHSPILMALTGADIFSFDGGRIKRVPYKEVEHVNLTRDFLNNPENFLRHL